MTSQQRTMTGLTGEACRPRPSGGHTIDTTDQAPADDSVTSVSPGTTEPGAPDRVWTLVLANGDVLTGHLPAWAEDDPSAEALPLERLGLHLVDMVHTASFSGVRLPVALGSGPVEPAVVLAAHIECRPYDDDPAQRVPLAYVQLADDVWAKALDPGGLSKVATVLRAQADRLEHDVRPALESARADWDVRHPDVRESGC